jgi:hypothetical protein
MPECLIRFKSGGCKYIRHPRQQVLFLFLQCRQIIGLSGVQKLISGTRIYDLLEVFYPVHVFSNFLSFLRKQKSIAEKSAP